jgi:AraC family transcriptional regulator
VTVSNAVMEETFKTDASSMTRFDLVRRQTLSFGAGVLLQAKWNGARLEYWRCEPQPLDECVMTNDLLALNLGPQITCRARWRGFCQQPSEMPTGGLTLLPSNVPYSIEEGNRFEGIVLALDRRELLGNELRTAQSAVIFPTVSVRDDFMRAAMTALYVDAAEGMANGSLYGDSLLASLALHVLVRHGTSPAPSRQDERLFSGMQQRTLIDFICDRLADPPSLTDMADRVRMDKFRFLRTFSRTYGATPHRFVLARRIERAKGLLRGTTTPVAEIALQCGFSDQSHFATIFRRQIGVTPTKYRSEVT